MTRLQDAHKADGRAGGTTSMTAPSRQSGTALASEVHRDGVQMLETGDAIVFDLTTHVGQHSRGAALACV